MDEISLVTDLDIGPTKSKVTRSSLHLILSVLA